jgi:hypothetical protein
MPRIWHVRLCVDRVWSLRWMPGFNVGFEHMVKYCHVSGLVMRPSTHCVPAWRLADEAQIGIPALFTYANIAP